MISYQPTRYAPPWEPFHPESKVTDSPPPPPPFLNHVVCTQLTVHVHIYQRITYASRPQHAPIGGSWSSRWAPLAPTPPPPGEAGHCTGQIAPPDPVVTSNQTDHIKKPITRKATRENSLLALYTYLAFWVRHDTTTATK